MRSELCVERDISRFASMTERRIIYHRDCDMYKVNLFGLFCSVEDVGTLKWTKLQAEQGQQMVSEKSIISLH